VLPTNPHHLCGTPAVPFAAVTVVHVEEFTGSSKKIITKVEARKYRRRV